MDIPSACLLLLGLVVTVLAHEAPTLPGVPGVPPTAHQHGAQGGHPNQGQAQHKPGTPPHPHHSFKEGSRDRGHVMDHLDGVVDKRQRSIDQMSEDEVQFHYFKLHDYDNNNMLDGLELVSALTHYHKDEDPNNVKPLSDADLKNLVDTILDEDDRNDDGYIDYAEFIVSQRT